MTQKSTAVEIQINSDETGSEFQKPDIDKNQGCQRFRWILVKPEVGPKYRKCSRLGKMFILL